MKEIFIFFAIIPLAFNTLVPKIFPFVESLMIGLGSLFNDISTFVGYLMPNLF